MNIDLSQAYNVSQDKGETRNWWRSLIRLKRINNFWWFHAAILSSLDVLCTFYIFFRTNLLIQCQVPIHVFSMFLALFRSDFGTGSKRNKIPEINFSRTEEDQGACGPSQESYREPTSPVATTRGRRLAGLWPPWRPPDIDPSPIYSLKYRKKSRDPRKYFSVAASFRFREISSGDPSRCPAGGDFGVGRLLHQHHRPSNDSWVVHFRPTSP